MPSVTLLMAAVIELPWVKDDLDVLTGQLLGGGGRGGRLQLVVLVLDLDHPAVDAAGRVDLRDTEIDPALCHFAVGSGTAGEREHGADLDRVTRPAGSAASAGVGGL